MQNKVYADDIYYSGYRYVIKEEGKDFINQTYPNIVGFDSIYIEGYLYKVKLKETCASGQEIRQDVLSCSLQLISIISREEQTNPFINNNKL
ncbi:hypothetical protein [Sphingobacterium corticibacter]|uniref:Uncharacterized protein n=1 Tax=Sphingobacterium corticibacter TaxID=2171749 RepID=A0A2T8HJP1_9SPHI|nr:hypothetical protein [Sphingobacterium corticibacter]PVH25668.1 hypothetical protein DC487_06925 [Sphingobacterium corticibacter]